MYARPFIFVHNSGLLGEPCAMRASYSQGSDHRALLAYLPVLLGVVWTFDIATQMRMFIFGFLIETLATYPGVARLSTYVPVEVRSRGTVTHTTPVRAGKCTTCPLGLYGVIKWMKGNIKYNIVLIFYLIKVRGYEWASWPYIVVVLYMCACVHGN